MTVTIAEEQLGHLGLVGMERIVHGAGRMTVGPESPPRPANAVGNQADWANAWSTILTNFL